MSITGTPTAAGTETFTVTATDCWGPRRATNYSITVNSAVTLSPLTLPADTATVPYSQTITAGGGTENKTLTVSNIQNAVAGLIVPASGTNTLASRGRPRRRERRRLPSRPPIRWGPRRSTNYSITVNSAVTLSPSTLPADTVRRALQPDDHGQRGHGQHDADGQQHPERHRRPRSCRPAGRTRLAITGTPTAAGTETFTVTATDSLGATTTRDLQHDGQLAGDAQPVDAAGRHGNVPYSQTITAGGGTGNKTLTVSNIQNAIAGLIVPAAGRTL